MDMELKMFLKKQKSVFSRKSDISKYSLDEVLGQGSFARVFKAFHSNGY